eukprot:4701844-Ditylum_brightwellii.AAC.1
MEECTHTMVHCKGCMHHEYKEGMCNREKVCFQHDAQDKVKLHGLLPKEIKDSNIFVDAKTTSIKDCGKQNDLAA